MLLRKRIWQGCEYLYSTSEAGLLAARAACGREIVRMRE